MLVYSNTDFIEKTVKQRKFEKIVCDLCGKGGNDLYFNIYYWDEDIGRDYGEDIDACQNCLPLAIARAMKRSNNPNFNLRVDSFRASEHSGYESIWSVINDITEE